ncbi:MAG TPA: recombinase family protein [Actinocrinis sp.]|jgi:DNA invertase Pin-like site-specific DNA recombinase|uniref:recombinase family protein n=1 Tax=Actinocrinis sp. TaxID=1920516 RepID=UPI002DDCAAC5|nr:recombinase family protein [Actinocrinis sp.]HEV3170365.1 recombinase family protein [Actinocrinis sp.]
MKADISSIRIAPYARISDTDEERAPGLDRQLRIVLPLISNHGVATHEYIDNDKSAYKPEVIRDEGFEPWLQDFVDNQNDGIAGWDLDRIFRQPSDLERVIKAYCHAYIKEGRIKPVLLLPSMSIDLTDEDGQMVARMLVNIANHSSAKTVKRVTNFYRDEALKGNVFSSYPAFYRNPDGSINEDKAVITHKAISDVFAGIRPTAIAEEWRQKGITTARGGRVTGETVRRILIAPGIAGLAVYKRELVLDKDGHPVMRADGGLIDVATWRALCETLKSRRRGARPTRGLLSRTLRCGKCGSYMVHQRRSDTFFMYNCRSKDSGGCAVVAISGPRLDAQITELVLAYLDQPIEAPKEQAVPGAARLKEIERLVTELMGAYRAGEMSGSIVFPSIKELEDEQKKLRSEVAQQVRKTKQVTSVAEEWPELPLDRKQAILEELFEAIVVAPAKNVRAKGVQTTYDENRVTVVWRSPK